VIDGKEEQIDMEIFPDGSIDFFNYDIESDIIAAELGDEPSELYKFISDWDGYERIKLVKFAEDDYWADALVAAVGKQGLSGFKSEDYLSFLSRCLGNGVGDEFDPMEEIKRILTKGQYIEFLKDCLLDQYSDYDFSPDVELIGLMGREPFVDWLLSDLKKHVEKDDGSTASHLATFVHTDKDNIEITSSFLGMYDADNEYTNTIGKEYCLNILDMEIACWKIVVESRIIDPISFDVEVDEWNPGDMGSEYGVSDALSGVMSELDIDEPELDDPEPPYFPKPDPKGNFAAAYLVGDQWAGARPPYWIIVPYESNFDATEAAELSRIVMDRDGYDDVWIRVLQKKKDIEIIEDEDLQVLGDYAQEKGTSQKSLKKYLGRVPNLSDLFLLASELYRRGETINFGNLYAGRRIQPGMYITRDGFFSYTEHVEDGKELDAEWANIYEVLEQI